MKTRQPNTHGFAHPHPQTRGGGAQAVRHRCHPATSPGALEPHRPPPRGDGAIFESSPLLVQSDCSPLQVLCKPGAGGNRPAGSSKMQDRAQPPAGRWERGGARETVLLVGTRGTRKGNGHQHHCWGQWNGCREKVGAGPIGSLLPPSVAISSFQWECVMLQNLAINPSDLDAN